MKTLFQPIHSLSGFLHYSADVNLAKQRFGTDDSVLSTKLQEDDIFIVSVPAPGLSKEDLNVYIDGRMLFITKKRQVKLAEQQNGLNNEFKYSFVLPDGIDTDCIEGKCRHGLLTIKLKKTKSKNCRTVIKVLGDANAGNNTRQSNTFWNKLKAKMDIRKFVQRQQSKPSKSGVPMTS